MTDAIKKLIQSARRPRGWDDELPSKVGDRAEAQLTALEAEREALREALKGLHTHVSTWASIAEGELRQTMGNSDYGMLVTRLDEADAALTSAPSDKVLVPLDRLREINTALAALALSQEGERRERATFLMDYTASLTGKEGDGDSPAAC